MHWIRLKKLPIDRSRFSSSRGIACGWNCLGASASALTLISDSFSSMHHTLTVLANNIHYALYVCTNLPHC